jgi:hypothetical protein
MDLAGANPLNEPLLTSEQIAEAIRRTDQFQKSIKREKSKE